MMRRKNCNGNEEKLSAGRYRFRLTKACISRCGSPLR
jgi:hypothetical protein